MSISNFYANQEIFITGGTGFIGKGLIEKLIRSFPDLGKIFVLVRCQKGKTPNQRLEEILNKTVFERARNEQPKAFSKIVPIAGDCEKLGLGISQEDMEKIKNVTLIFNSAACVRFDDHLRSAILLNIRGTHELVKIAESLKKLKAFIHISTTYSNPDRQLVEEIIYPAYADWRTAIRLAETYDEETLNVLFSKYSSEQPNTYTFTKSLGEHIINDYRHQLPVMVFRPSIVVSSIEEPVPGWIDNFNGPIGMLVACGLGLMRTNYGDPDVILDIIPVDITVKSLLVAGYKVGTQSRATDRSTEVEVVNCANSTLNCLSLGDIIELGKKEVQKNPIEKCIWMPDGSITKCIVWHYIRFFTTQIVLAIIIDTCLRLTKQKPSLLKIQRRIHAAYKALYVFSSNEWKICNENCIKLENLVPPQDYEKLSFISYTSANKVDYFASGIRGAKQFLLNETPVASKQAKMRMKMFVILHYLIQFIGVYLIGKFIIRYLLNCFTSF